MFISYSVQMEHCTLITTDINRRVETHKGKGAKYTKTRLPVVLMVSFESTDS
jgi:predicted GIY-YIG superfamily endonuclease